MKFARSQTLALQGPPISEMTLIFESPQPVCKLDGSRPPVNLDEGSALGPEIEHVDFGSMHMPFYAKTVIERELANASLPCHSAWKRLSRQSACSPEFLSRVFSISAQGHFLHRAVCALRCYTGLVLDAWELSL